MDNIEAIILFLQLVLIGGQLYLSYKINQQSLSKDKGYFILDDRHHIFNLRNALRFIAVGGNDIIFTGNSIEVNGVTRESNSTPKETFFTKNGGFNILDIPIPFSENDLKKEKVVTKMKFHLRNPQNYSYTEMITMEFSKAKESADVWEIIRFNLEFGK